MRAKLIVLLTVLAVAIFAAGASADGFQMAKHMTSQAELVSAVRTNDGGVLNATAEEYLEAINDQHGLDLPNTTAMADYLESLFVGEMPDGVYMYVRLLIAESGEHPLRSLDYDWQRPARYREPALFDSDGTPIVSLFCGNVVGEYTPVTPVAAPASTSTVAQEKQANMALLSWAETPEIVPYKDAREETGKAENYKTVRSVLSAVGAAVEYYPNPAVEIRRSMSVLGGGANVLQGSNMESTTSSIGTGGAGGDGGDSFAGASSSSESNPHIKNYNDVDVDTEVDVDNQFKAGIEIENEIEVEGSNKSKPPGKCKGKKCGYSYH